MNVNETTEVTCPVTDCGEKVKLTKHQDNGDQVFLQGYCPGCHNSLELIVEESGA